MTMTSREIAVLERHALAQEELVKAIKGGTAAKKLREERLALEEARGGARRLAEAEKILREAAAQAEALLKQAREEVAALLSRAEASVKARQDALVVVATQLDARESALNKQRAALAEAERSVREIEKRQTTKDQGLAVVAGEIESRNNALRQREAECRRREDDIRRFDEWRAKAPA